MHYERSANVRVLGDGECEVGEPDTASQMRVYKGQFVLDVPS